VPFLDAVAGRSHTSTLVWWTALPSYDRTGGGSEGVRHMDGRTATGRIETVTVVARRSPVANYGPSHTPCPRPVSSWPHHGSAACCKATREAWAAAFSVRRVGR